MRTLAEDLAEHFCQDSIIVSLKTCDEKACSESSMGVKWDPATGLAGKRKKPRRKR